MLIEKRMNHLLKKETVMKNVVNVDRDVLKDQHMLLNRLDEEIQQSTTLSPIVPRAERVLETRNHIPRVKEETQIIVQQAKNISNSGKSAIKRMKRDVRKARHNVSSSEPMSQMVDEALVEVDDIETGKVWHSDGIVLAIHKRIIFLFHHIVQLGHAAALEDLVEFMPRPIQDTEGKAEKAIQSVNYYYMIEAYEREKNRLREIEAASSPLTQEYMRMERILLDSEPLNNKDAVMIGTLKQAAAIMLKPQQLFDEVNDRPAISLLQQLKECACLVHEQATSAIKELIQSKSSYDANSGVLKVDDDKEVKFKIGSGTGRFLAEMFNTVRRSVNLGSATLHKKVLKSAFQEDDNVERIKYIVKQINKCMKKVGVHEFILIDKDRCFINPIWL